MKIFGISVSAIFIIVLFFWLGTKFPTAFRGIPVIG